MRSENSKDIPAVELPTLLLTVCVYFCWWYLTVLMATAPAVAAPLLIITITLHGSLVHEIIHGHPTRWILLNTVLGYLPLGLIYPFHLFKQLHLTHHTDANLTIPGLDPESFFHHPDTWQQKCRVSRSLHWFNMTLVGRLLLGPIFSTVDVLSRCFRDLTGNSKNQRLWLWGSHFLTVPAIIWFAGSGDLRLMVNYVLCAYVAMSLLGMRSFYEHRTAGPIEQRIVVVNACHFFKFLFLSNNFHVTHHRYPWMPWYMLERRFHAEYEGTLKSNGNFYFDGYAKWLNYLFTPVASPIYPDLPEQAES